MTKPNHIKAFLKAIEGFRYEHNIIDLFRDWTELVAAELHQAPYHAGLCAKDDAFEQAEARYMEVAKRYQRPDFDRFAEMLAITRMALAEEMQDFLGQCYMQLEISNERAGQFFTPYEVSLLIAQLAIGNPSPQIEETGFITLHEPACGSGGMIIAVADTLEKAKHDSMATLYFDAVDIDRRCANMTYIQTGLLGLTGTVWHGDTLRMEMRSHRFTPAARANPQRTHRMLDYVEGRDIEKPPAIDWTQPLEQLTLLVADARGQTGKKETVWRA
ncbi:MAG: SAM-dependent DNA methyltransferase [Caldilineaceae bacterium]|nr:SAM-dependent DNA methyltransferase [Caldilineaceae bacterium]